MHFSLRQKDKIDYCWQHLLDSYKKYVKPSAVVLEIGASVTHKTEDLAQYCCKVVGLEKCAERKPVDKGNIEYVLGNWEHLSDFVKPDSIDLAVSSHTIEHVERDLEAINQLYIVLKKGGVALINTPNRKRMGNILIELYKGKRVFPYRDHMREYDFEDFKALLDKSLFCNSYYIMPVALGFQAFQMYLYLRNIPPKLKKFCTFWEAHLYKK